MILIGEGTAKDENGHEHKIKVELEDSGYIPDVYVTLLSPHNKDHSFFDDTVFIRNIFLNVIRPAGYAGPIFGRAELGMQDDDFIVLEPREGFREFAESKGFKDLNDEQEVTPVE